MLMGFSFKDIAAVINPTAAIGTIGAIGGDIYGAREGRKATEEANTANAHQAALDRQMQIEFAKNGIRWRVEDAQAAGIHPLAALGASGAQYSPSSIPVQADYSKSDLYSKMGQNISRAVMATQTADERVMTKLQQQRMMLENHMLQLDINSRLNPPAPSMTVEEPLRRVAAELDRNWQEVGSYPSVAYMKSPTGLVPIMPPNLAEALESDNANQKQWMLRYKGGPNVHPTERPSNRKLPPGKIGWKWSYKAQEWRPVTRKEAMDAGRKAAEEKWFKRKQTNTDIWKMLKKVRQ